jgi:hypothetical protein
VTTSELLWQGNKVQDQHKDPKQISEEEKNQVATIRNHFLCLLFFGNRNNCSVSSFVETALTETLPMSVLRGQERKYAPRDIV